MSDRKLKLYMDIPLSHIEMREGQAFLKCRNLKVRMVAGMYVKAGATIEASTI